MSTGAAVLAETAFAKINLALHVTGRRADGYHTLDSLVVFAGDGDRLALDPAQSDAFSVSGRFAHQTPLDASNLVLRARDHFRAQSGRTEAVSLHLEKNLPVASGLGGGSADAAAVLRAFCRLHADTPELGDLALRLGADVPMCLHSRPLLARGIGEELRPVSGIPPLAIVLVNPGVAVSTPAVFGRLARRDNPPLPALPPSLNFAALLAWLAETRNDLEAPALALAPSIGAARAALETAGAAFTRMSGSGATCFGLFASRPNAEQAAAAITTAEPHWFVLPTESRP